MNLRRDRMEATEWRVPYGIAGDSDIPCPVKLSDYAEKSAWGGHTNQTEPRDADRCIKPHSDKEAPTVMPGADNPVRMLAECVARLKGHRA